MSPDARLEATADLLAQGRRPMTLRVTVTDVETGGTDTVTVAEGEYLLGCHAPAHLAHVAKHANGTHVLTVKNGPT